MKHLVIFLLFTIVVYAEDNTYSSISSRNAFELLDQPETQALPPITDILLPPIKLHLTGITKIQGITNVYFFSKDIPRRFLKLNLKRKTAGVITLLSVDRGVVKVLNNGIPETLTFDTHRLPSTLVLPINKSKPTIITSRKDSKKDKQSKKSESSTVTPRASIVKVPSRRPKVDPRIIEKSLEYISKIDDEDKRDYLLKRVESLQSGQYQIQSEMDKNERRRQYDEWRKRNDRDK